MEYLRVQAQEYWGQINLFGSPSSLTRTRKWPRSDDQISLIVTSIYNPKLMDAALQSIWFYSIVRVLISRTINFSAIFTITTAHHWQVRGTPLEEPTLDSSSYSITDDWSPNILLCMFLLVSSTCITNNTEGNNMLVTTSRIIKCACCVQVFY